MNCTQIILVLRHTIHQFGIIADIIGYIVSYYRRITKPLIAASTNAIVTLLHGKMTAHISWCYTPWSVMEANGNTPTSHELDVRYHLAARSYPDALDVSARPNDPHLPGTASLYTPGAMVDFRRATLMACTNQVVVTCVNNRIYEISFAHLLFEVHRKLWPEHVKEIMIPVYGDVVTLSCGNRHSGAIIHECIQNGELKRVSKTILWGDNTYNQLGHLGKTSDHVAWTSNTAVSVICVGDSTLLLDEGAVKFCGQWSTNQPPMGLFVKIALMHDPARALEIRLVPGRVVVYTDRGIEHITLRGIMYDARGVPVTCTPANMLTCQRAKHTNATDVVHTSEGALPAYSDSLWFNGMFVCKWSDIGGL